MPRRLVRKTVVYDYAVPSEDDSDYDPEQDEAVDSADGDSCVDTECDTFEYDSLPSDSQASCYFTESSCSSPKRRR